MVVILHADIEEDSPELYETMAVLSALPGVHLMKHVVEGEVRTLTELYLLGDTSRLDATEIEALPGVDRAIRISESYRILGRHDDSPRAVGFTYNGVRFGQDNLNIFAGLCAVDNREHVAATMAALRENGLDCTRMGAYKPRTNPYSFQGHGASCLPYVFDLAGRYDIRVIAMEITHESQIGEIDSALEASGAPTGVMLQIGTRNTQNFELLKAVGRQSNYPVLFKRGFGITLGESLNAAEYLASEGNARVVFCLRGIKSATAAPHRNLVDFGHIPVVKRLTRMPVCVDPSHSVGVRSTGPDGIEDILHATAQGIIAGANMVLIDFHPNPATALVDGPQALRLNELAHFVEDVRLVREAYERRTALAKHYKDQRQDPPWVSLKI